MSDAERLAGYIDVWWGAVQDFVALIEQVPAHQWSNPTDLPGWSVQDCVSHTAHLESVLAGRGEETADLLPAEHITSPTGAYTEIGVVNRRNRQPAELIAEIREVTALRHQKLLDNPPTDAAALPEVRLAGVPWPWEVQLRNRPLDVWMHEQDIRRAVGMPGAMDSAAADHTVKVLSAGFGFVLAKKVAAAPGTTAVLEIEGERPLAFTVSDAGRGEQLSESPQHPSVRVLMDRDSFIRLAGGRSAPEPGAVTVEGDEELGRRLLAAMAVTP